MRTNNKISAYILRGSTTALLFSCLIVALCSAINLPEQLPKARSPRGNAVFDANGHESATLSFADRVACQRAIEGFTGDTASGQKSVLIQSLRSMR